MNKENEEEKAELTFKEQYDKISSTPEMAAILKQHGEIYLQGKEGEIGRKAMGKGWKMVDDALIEATGLEGRPEGLTTSDWAKEIALENKKLKDELSANEASPIVDNEEKKLHAIEVQTLKAQLKEQMELNDNLKSSGIKKETSQLITNALQGSNFEPALSETVLSDLIEMRKNKLVSNSKVVDGKTIFYKDNSEPYMNLNGLPMSAKEVSQVVFKDLLFTKKAGGNADSSDKPEVKGDFMVLPNATNIKTFGELRVEFAKAMSAKGWASHEQRYIKLMQGTIKHYKLDKLRME